MKIIEAQCPCCRQVLRISEENYDRLAAAATLAFPGVKLDIGTVIGAGVDWTAEVSDAVIGLVVVEACSAFPDVPGQPVTSTRY